MKIYREFKVIKVEGTIFFNEPIKIIMGDLFTNKNEFPIVFDDRTCKRHNIPISITDLVGHKFLCSFESREIPMDGDQINMVDIGKDDLRIDMLSEVRVQTKFFGIQPLLRQDKTSKTLELSSFNGYFYAPTSVSQCPNLKFVLKLSDKEYEECDQLPPNTVFTVSFCVGEKLGQS